MSKIKLEDIKTQVAALGWKVISQKYENLDAEMTFECDEGHIFYTSWKKLRNKPECPICKANQYKNQDTKVIPKTKGSKRTLALDQATKVTGYSVFDDQALVKYGIYETTQEEQTSRNSEVKNWLISMINTWQPDYIAFEGIQLQSGGTVGNMGVTTYEALARLQGVLMVTAYEMKIPFEIFPTNTWRASCGVKGRTRSEKKRSMRELAKTWFDISITEDEADAIGIGKHAAIHFNKKVEVFDWEI